MKRNRQRRTGLALAAVGSLAGMALVAASANAVADGPADGGTVRSEFGPGDDGTKWPTDPETRTIGIRANYMGTFEFTCPRGQTMGPFDANTSEGDLAIGTPHPVRANGYHGTGFNTSVINRSKTAPGEVVFRWNCSAAQGIPVTVATEVPPGKQPPGSRPGYADIPGEATSVVQCPVTHPYVDPDNISYEKSSLVVAGFYAGSTSVTPNRAHVKYYNHSTSPQIAYVNATCWQTPVEH